MTLVSSPHSYAIDPRFRETLVPIDPATTICKFLAPSLEFASYPLERAKRLGAVCPARAGDATDSGDLVLDPTCGFEPGYGFDWEACRAAIEYFSKIAPPPEEKGGCVILGGTGRRLSRQRPGGRFSDAPRTMQDRATIRKIIGHKPILVLSRQDGREEDHWRTPFWWPVLYPPAKAAPSVFASSTGDAVPDEEDSDD